MNSLLSSLWEAGSNTEKLLTAAATITPSGGTKTSKYSLHFQWPEHLKSRIIIQSGSIQIMTIRLMCEEVFFIYFETSVKKTNDSIN